MIKWLVKKYLKQLNKNVDFQILSVEQELGYSDYLNKDLEKELLDYHNKYTTYRNSLKNIMENL